jgi:hypothetical protein
MPGLISNLNSSNLSLLNGYDYRCEPLVHSPDYFLSVDLFSSSFILSSAILNVPLSLFSELLIWKKIFFAVVLLSRPN